jgi:hypothetical protein
VKQRGLFRFEVKQQISHAKRNGNEAKRSKKAKRNEIEEVKQKTKRKKYFEVE